MAGKAKTVLKILGGTAACATVYVAGSRMGKKEGMEEALAATAVMPRPGMRSTQDVINQGGPHSKMYHESVTACAQDLRERIATQICEGFAAPEDEVEQAQDVKVSDAASDEPKDSFEDSDLEDSEDPYLQIHEAITSSELFDESGEKAYKPTPFTMPGKPKQ